MFEAQLKSDRLRSEHAFTFTTRSLVASRAAVSKLLGESPQVHKSHLDIPHWTVSCVMLLAGDQCHKSS